MGQSYFTKGTNPSVDFLAPTAVVIERGQSANFVSAGAGTTVIKTSPAILAQVMVTSLGTGASSSPVYFYDSPSGASSPFFAVPGNAAIGTIYPVGYITNNGLTVVNITGGPAMTVTYD